MTKSQKETLFQTSFLGAGLLYLWALFIFWMAPEWELAGMKYYVLGVLPALGGVVSLSFAIGLHVELQKGED
ncbi:MAG: hypothetical protein ABEL97_08420 [Salinibacter sp.]